MTNHLDADSILWLRDYAATRLADFKVPRAVYFLEEFPTAELGKISKKDLRELADSY